jgi:uncharacterized coiled-coil DUF342 family protein
MWRLRRKTERGWNDGFHINTKAEAEGLCELLNKLAGEVERERALANEAIATWKKTREERDEAREQRDRLADQIEANHKGTLMLERMVYQLREQNDRLAEALQRVRDGYGGQLASPNCCDDCDFLIPIDKALQSLIPKP